MFKCYWYGRIMLLIMPFKVEHNCPLWQFCYGQRGSDPCCNFNFLSLHLFRNLIIFALHCVLRDILSNLLLIRKFFVLFIETTVCTCLWMYGTQLWYPFHRNYIILIKVIKGNKRKPREINFRKRWCSNATDMVA